MLCARFEVSDCDTVVYQDDSWQIREHCWRGYEPWWTLHKRKKLFCFSFWSGMCKLGNHKSDLTDFITRWNAWPDYKDKTSAVI